MKEEQKKEAWEKYKFAIDARNLEINLFWQRSLLYWGFIVATLVAYSQLVDTHKTISFFVALLGFFLSFCWSLLNRGSKWWQESWEQKIAEIEKDDEIKLFHGGKNSKKQNWWLYAKRFSPSKLTIAVSDVFSFFWFVIVAKGIYLQFANYAISDCSKNIIYIVSPIFLIFILVLLWENSRGQD